MAVDTGEFLLDEGMFWCRSCQRDRSPAPGSDGARRYSCGPGCAQPDTPAVPLEQAALLGALIRGYAVLCGIGRGPVVFRAWDTLADWGDSLPPSAEERRRWEGCEISNRRAVLRAAYTRLEIDARVVIHRIWRHHSKSGGAS